MSDASYGSLMSSLKSEKRKSPGIGKLISKLQPGYKAGKKMTRQHTDKKKSLNKNSRQRE